MKVKDMLQQLHNTLRAMAHAGRSAKEVLDCEVVVRVKGEKYSLDGVRYSHFKHRLLLVGVRDKR